MMQAAAGARGELLSDRALSPASDCELQGNLIDSLLEG